MRYPVIVAGRGKLRSSGSSWTVRHCVRSRHRLSSDPAGRLTADDADLRIVVRHRAAGAGRGPADDLAARVVERARLRRRFERQSDEGLRPARPL